MLRLFMLYVYMLSFQQFDVYNSTVLAKFCEWLQGIDGRENDESAAQAISRDLNKSDS